MQNVWDACGLEHYRVFSRGAVTELINVTSAGADPEIYIKIEKENSSWNVFVVHRGKGSKCYSSPSYISSQAAAILMFYKCFIVSYKPFNSQRIEQELNENGIWKTVEVVNDELLSCINSLEDDKILLQYDEDKLCVSYCYANEHLCLVKCDRDLQAIFAYRYHVIALHEFKKAYHTIVKVLPEIRNEYFPMATMYLTKY